MWQRLKRWAKALRNDVMTLWFAAYALSPFDLIPDFIPVLGYLDEVILLPIGIVICLKMIPNAVLADCRASADRWLAERQAKPRSWIAAAVILLLWLCLVLTLTFAIL
jgi:uncharacterized membrane protein YkvA (DUF1232 family)